MALVQSIRFVVAWLWTLLCGGFSCLLFLIIPRAGWRLMARTWGRGALWLIGVRVEIEGAERLVGPAVFISNHQSLMDVVLMPAVLPRALKFVAKKELLRVPLWGWAFARGGGLMIDRRDPRGAIAAIEDGLRRMPPDWSVAVFPEGTRSRDGQLKAFKKGAFHIAMQRRLPIVPVGLEGARDAVPKGAWFVRPATVYVTVGEPIPTDTWTLATIDEHVAVGRAAVARCIERSRQRKHHALGQVGADQAAPLGV